MTLQSYKKKQAISEALSSAQNWPAGRYFYPGDAELRETLLAAGAAEIELDGEAGWLDLEPESK